MSFSEDQWEAAVATAERRYRIARHEFDLASTERQAALEAAIENGLARSRAATILDVSAGRVTQLLRPNITPPTDGNSKKLKLNEARIMALIGDNDAPMDAKAIAQAGRDIVEITAKEPTAQNQLTSLASRGWLDGSKADGYSLTEKGATWYAAQSSRLGTNGPVGEAAAKDRAFLDLQVP